jgi:histidinol-phosphate aminotransferase
MIDFKPMVGIFLRGTKAESPKPRAAVLAMKEYHPPLGHRDGLRLDFNENTFACSPRVVETLSAITRDALTKYPERAPVEALVAAKLGLAPEQVLLTNGVDEAIHVLCQTWLEPGTEILLPVPTYSMYEVYASSTGATIVTVQADPDFTFPYERVLAAITPRTRIIALATPNSPTGSTIARLHILALARAAPHAIILVDEAYYHFFRETVIDCIGKIPNVIVARTFSKAYGLAGLRLGLLAASDEAMLWMRRVISPYSVNALALACLPAALDDDAYLHWYIEEVTAARAAFITAVSRLQIPHWPSQGNFLLLDIGAKHREFVREMHQRRVLVRDRSADPGCQGCVRVTIGPREQMQNCHTALAASLAAIAWKPGASIRGANGQ